MASSTQMRRDSDVDEKPGARISLSASETAHKVGRRRFGEFVNLVRGPVAALSAEQNLLVKRDLLESLSRRVVYWMALMLFVSLFVFALGNWIKRPDIYGSFEIQMGYAVCGLIEVKLSLPAIR
ncbi:hypothetical protein EVC45_45125, partial [Paraburkholderia sp. UYCP14C]|uniref:hypothetical protein n=1 Tax=Paraburkholderia sp. UYCP14C TaxID=2511130 RepID=UPI00101F337F